MRTTVQKVKLGILLLGFMLVAITGNSQTTGTAVTMTLKNEVQTAPNIFEYEVWLTNTGTTSLQLRGYSFGINHATGLENGGVIKHIFVSRDPIFNTVAAFPSASVGYTASSGHLRVTTTNATAGNEIALAPGVPIRLATMRIADSNSTSTAAVSFAANFNPWNPLTSPLNILQTITASGKTQCVATLIINPGGTPGSSFAVNGTANAPASGTVQALTGIYTPHCFYLNPTGTFTASNTALTPVVCFGASTGTAQVTLSSTGSAAPSGIVGTYKINGGSSLPYTSNPFSISGLSAGTNTVTVTTSFGCVDTANVLTTQPASANISSFSASACNSYTWTGTTYTTSNSYTKTFVTPAGCDSIRTLNLTINQSSPSSSFTASVCSNSSYTWTTGSTYTATGNYTLTFINASGCDSVRTLNLTVNPTSSSTTTVSAAGNYTWSANSVNYTTSGSYTASFLNSNGCDSIATLNLTITGANFSLTDSIDQTISCAGFNDGGIGALATPNGPGTFTFTYSIDGGAFSSNNSFSGLAPGQHTICATDGTFTLCDTITMTQPDPLSLIFSTDSTVSCLGNDGGISVTITGGTAVIQPLNTTWTNSSSVILNPVDNYATSITGLPVGNYFLYVEDDNGCSITGSTSLAATAAIVVSASNTPIACNGGTSIITATSSGGTGNKVLTINGLPIASNYVAGTYTITATDTKGCTGTSVLAITQPSVLSSSSNVSACNSYLWSANNSTYTLSGVYSTTFVNASNCDSIVSINLTINTSTINAPQSATACGSYTWAVNGLNYTSTGTKIATYSNISGCDSSYTLNLTINNPTSSTSSITAANIYTWPVNGVTYTNSGLYTATSLNSAGCLHTSTLNLTINIVAFTVSADIDQNVSCFGQNDAKIQATAVGAGPFTYILDGGAGGSSSINLTGSFINLAPGIHTVCAIAGTLIACDTVLVTEPLPLQASFTTDSLVSCLGDDGMLTINIGGGTNLAQGYLTWWMNSAGDTLNYPLDVNNFGNFDLYCDSLHVGLIHVVVEDDNGCFITAFGSMQAAPPIAAFATNTPIICNGGTSVITPSATGGVIYPATVPPNPYLTPNYTYLINGLPVASSYPAGTYTITAMDSKGCSATTVISITQPGVLTSSFSQTSCDSYTWSANSISYSVSGIYTATVLSVNNCDSIVTMDLTIKNSTTGSSSATACDIYTWIQNGNATYTSTGAYLHTFVNSVNCDSVHTLNLTINHSNTGSSTAAACNTYTWTQNGNAVYTVSGAYLHTFTNISNCDSVHTLNLVVNYSNSGSSTVTACSSYTWAQNGNAIYTVSGAYLHTFTNSTNCDSVHTLNLTINPASVPSSFPATSCYSYNWTGSTYTLSGSYTKTLQNVATCDSVVTLNLTINSSLDITNTTSGNLLSVQGNKSQTLTQNDGTTFGYYDTECKLIATIQNLASGASTGTTTARSIVDATIPVYNLQPYFARYYTIISSNTGQANLTLYLTQDDFNDYNANAGTFPQVTVPASPTNGSTASLCISQVPQVILPGAPGASTTEFPVIAVWNASLARWEVTISVTDLTAGYYFHACNPNLVPLSANVTSFTGHKGNSIDVLEWATSSEQNNNYFTLQHATDGIHFTDLAKVYSKANNGTSTSVINYSAENLKPSTGHNYYRLEQVDLNGINSYESKIIDLIWGADGNTITIYPNPTSDVLNIDLYTSQASNTVVKVLDMSGRLVKQVFAKSTTGMNTINISMTELSAGIYTVQIFENDRLSVIEKVRKND